MKFLITGGCGFLGSNLASAVMQKQHDLTILDSLQRMGSAQNLEWLRTLGPFQFLQKDIRVPEAVENAIASVKPDVILHLAGQVAMTTSIADPRLDFEINALGTLNVLEATRKHSPETIVIYSSTNKVYGDLEYCKYTESETRYACIDYPMGFPENITLEFHSPYGCSKGAADQYVLDYHRIFGLRTAVFRHSSMYGGRQYATYDQGWLGWFCQKAYDFSTGKKDPFTISGNGKQVRDLLHAKDMVDLYFRTIENIDRAKGLAFNVGGGLDNSLSLIELFGLLEEKLNVQLEYKVLPVRESDQRVFVADTSLAQKIMGWKPQVGKDTGLSLMLDWIRAIHN